MVMPTLHSFNKLGEMLVHKYERYLPTAFDESLTLLEKVNKIIEYLNETGVLVNSVVEDWNKVMEWVMNDGLKEGVIEKLDQMVNDGTMDSIINETIFNDLNVKIDNLSLSFGELETSVNNDINTFKTEVDQDIVDFKTEVDQDIVDFKTTINEDQNEFENQLNQNQEEFKNNVENDLSELSVNINGFISPLTVSHSKSPNPTMVIIDDDARNEVYDNLFPFMKQRNIPFTIAVPTGLIGDSNRISLSQFREMKDHSLVEYVSHTHNHTDLTAISNDQIYYEISEAEKFLRSEGIYTRHLVYPFGRYQHKLRDIMKECGINSASIVGSQVYRPNIHIMDSFYINRTTLETNIDTIKARIDLASNENGLFILNTHSQTIDYDKLQEIITYAINQGLNFKKFSEAFKDFSNIVELRRNETLLSAINCVGHSYGVKDVELYHPSHVEGARINGFTLTTPITSYEVEKTSIVTINSSNANRWGLPSAGILHTFRAHNDDYSYQLFYPIRNGQPLRRSWDTSSDSWYSFVDM